MSAAMPALLPCPFCGGVAEVEREGTGRQSCIVACSNCGCRLESNETGAGARWNERTAPAAPAPPPLPPGVRPVVVVPDPLPLRVLSGLVAALSPILGTDGVMDSQLAAQMGVRFAFRGADGPTADTLRAGRPSEEL